MKYLLITSLLALATSLYAQDAQDEASVSCPQQLSIQSCNQALRTNYLPTTLSEPFNLESVPDFSRLKSTCSENNVVTQCEALYYMAQKRSHLYGKDMEVASFDGEFECKAPYGYLTADYSICVKLVNTYNTALMSQQVLETRNQVAQQNTQADANQIQQNGDGQISSLEAVKTVNQGQASIETTRLSFYMTQGTALGAILYAWPSKDDPTSFCGQEESCQSLADGSVAHYFVNTEAKQKLALKLAEVAGQAVSSTLKRNSYNRNAQAVDQVQNQFENLQDEDEQGFDNCTLNPSLPGCSGTGSRTQLETAQFGGVSFGGGGTQDLSNTAAFGTDENGNPLPEFDSSDSEDDSNVATVASTFGDLKDASKELNAPAAADNTIGAQQGASGGGGAGGGSASAPGSTAKKAETGEEGPSEIKVEKLNNLSYGAGGGKIAGARGTNSKKNAGENPFSKLLGGKNKKQSATRVVASEIAQKSSKLFKQISNRYDSVVSQNRLDSVATTSPGEKPRTDLQ